MQKQVTFNPKVEYQYFDINETTIAGEKKIKKLSDKPSDLRNKKPRVKSNNFIRMNRAQLLTTNLRLINPDKRRYISSNNIHIKDNKTETMEIGIPNDVEPMEVD
jgi:NAD+--asparagine ADP-ribosyltransferase